MIEFAAATGPKLKLDPASVLDIGACIVEGNDLAPGRAIPDDGDPRIDHSLEGFLFTCGPDHIRHRQPMTGAFAGKSYPLHGSFSSHPANVLWTRFEDGNAACRADRVVNTSAETMPVFLMYHMNVGGKWFDPGVRLEGEMLEGSGFPWTFGEELGGIFCVAAPATEGKSAEVSLGPIAAIGGRTLRVRFDAQTLPFLQVWRNQKAPANVLGIEPVSHRWVGRVELEKAGEFNMVEPGESRSFALSFAFV
jgi:hypothetical protein